MCVCVIKRTHTHTYTTPRTEEVKMALRSSQEGECVDSNGGDGGGSK